MLEIIFSQEAQAYLDNEGILSLSITVETIPCGCVRPREVPTIKQGVPTNSESYERIQIKELDVYIAKGMSIPKDRIEIKMGSLANEKKLYPTGISYFNGMGTYCEL